jgi:hypothetical protein
MNANYRLRSNVGKALIFLVIYVVMVTVGASVSLAGDNHRRGSVDFGLTVERLLNSQAEKLFGIEKPLDKSASPTETPYRTVEQDAKDQVLSARGLKVEYLTRESGNKTDQMAFFPEEAPTHLIVCVEGKREVIGTNPDGTAKYNPSIQRIDLFNGEVETILRGMNRCDGIRTTPWGTILATEETSDGGAYEIMDPLFTTEQTVINRATGEVTDPVLIAKRTALPTIAWEGLTVLPSGVVIGGDELRPGTDGPDSDGGAIFKFVPDNLFSGNGDIAGLSSSPLTSGVVNAMQISCREASSSRFPQFGQGCEVGQGTWVEVNASTARADADTRGATGYYRPEDLHRDSMFSDKDFPGAVRFCWTNTGREKAYNFAEVMCAIDYEPVNPKSLVVANRFVEGDPEFNSFDNLAFQPVTGNLYIIEDHKNGDIFACLPDGADRDIKSDGCVRTMSVKDSSAEPTGFIFSADGKTAYLSIQHSNDDLMPLYDDYPTDDVLRITGFSTVKRRGHHMSDR